MSFDIDADLTARVQARLDSLTKPRGSLGRLEELVLRLAQIQQSETPSATRKGMFLFCADHGVTAQGVSAYPREVTAQMVANFARGGAAINVLCRQFGIRPVVIDIGVAGSIGDVALAHKIAAGTSDFTTGPAMTPAQARDAVAIGGQLAEDAALTLDLAGIGEMGIGNSTTAAALMSAFTGEDPALCVGAGTGLTAEGIGRKVEVVRRALQLHRPDRSDPIGVLAAVGGFEIAAMAGFLVTASQRRLPVFVDGFISCSAALVARALDPQALATAFFSHLSAERGHALLLEHLNARPCLALDMRLGEGTGAALAMNLVETATTLYREMATFDEAGVTSE